MFNKETNIHGVSFKHVYIFNKDTGTAKQFNKSAKSEQSQQLIDQWNRRYSIIK